MSNINFNKKKILLVCPAFYEYPLIIKSKLEELGAEVSYFSDKKYTIIDSILLHISTYFYFSYSKIHYWKILRKIKNLSFDYLFVVKGSGMPIKFISEFKARNCNARTILYQWDSKKSFNYEYLIDSFDSVYSFDFLDIENDSRIKYQQLFASDDIIIKCNDHLPEKCIDLFFLASYTHQRYLDLLLLQDISISLALNFRFHLFIYRKTYFKEKFLMRRKLNKKLLAFHQMSRTEYIEFMKDSLIIVDSSHSAQSGLTMRSIEALACGKFLLSNNPSFNSSFFSKDINVRTGFTEENIKYFMDLNNSKVRLRDNLEKYTVSHWINSIFS